jgi:predicted DCC family thiol-disulfide oxidoreductase YuxK
MSAFQGVILFDGVCNFCNTTINFIIDHDPKQRFRFASLQSDAGQQLLRRHHEPTTDFDSVILLKGGKVFHKSDAALEIALDLGGLWPLLYGFKIVPRFVRNAVYDFVARNRYRWFGRLDACRLPTPELRGRFL